MMETALVAPISGAACALAARREGYALRGFAVLLLLPLVAWAIWKKRRR